MKVSAVCRVLAFTVIVSLLILVMGFGISAQAAKLGLASAWLFEENGGKVVKDIIWIHDADYPVFMWHVKGEVGRIDGKTIVADGEWHHIAKIYGGKNVQMFVDGKLDGEAPSGGTLDTSKSPIWIGARPGNVAATGLFDEVGFFTEALSADELNDVMENGLADYAAVGAAGKLATTWAFLKSKK